MNVVQNLSAVACALDAPSMEFGHMPTRVMIAGEACPPALRPLCVEDERFTLPWLIHAHRTNGAGRPASIGCYFVADAIVAGNGYVYIQNGLVTSDDVMPYYVHGLIVNGNLDLGVYDALPIRTIDEPVIVYAGWGSTIYGHVLIDLLPRLHITEVSLKGQLGRPKLLVQGNIPNWHLAILNCLFGLTVDDFIFFNPAVERIHLRRAIIPALSGRRDGFLPYMHDVVSTIIQRTGASTVGLTTPRIMLSRAFFRDSHTQNRIFRNELEVAAIASREFGFSIMCPETMPWPTQVAMFAHAESIVGDFGSALHAAMFSPSGTRVASLGIGNMTQSFIGAVFEHDNAYLTVDGPLTAEFSVDENQFREFMDKAFGKPGQKAVFYKKDPDQMNIAVMNVPDHQGGDYQVMLGQLHALLNPATYFEIGTWRGESLALAQCSSIAVDPNFAIDRDVTSGKDRCMMFSMPSSDFFERYNPTTIFGQPIEMAFLDGLHHWEVLLQDFIGTEPHCYPHSVIVLHDCLPTDVYNTARSNNPEERTLSTRPGWWAGDVWKTLLVLRRLRPDLKILPLDASPTGLVVISNLDPKSAVLIDAYDDIIAEYADLHLADFGLVRFLNEVGVESTSRYTDFPSLRARLGLRR